MGNAESKKDEPTNQDRKTEKVFLNVYESQDQPIANNPLLGIYHTGVEVYGAGSSLRVLINLTKRIEYTFAGHETSRSTGVFSHRPRNPGEPWTFKEQIEMGSTTLSKPEIQQLITEMKREYIANSYDTFSKNCNHFSDDLCKRLVNKSIPGWVNRAAKVGNALKSVLPTTSQTVDSSSTQVALSTTAVPPEGIDLYEYIKTDSIECLNQSQKNPISNVFAVNKKSSLLGKAKETFLESDCDEQLLIHIPFKENVKLQSLVITSVADGSRAPKLVKLYINQRSMNFDDVNTVSSVQEVTLSTQQLQGEKIVLKATKFQNINHLTIFVASNTDGSDTTKIASISLFGIPLKGATGVLSK